MIKTILVSLAAFILLWGIGELSISFKPFSISLPCWRSTLGTLLLFMSLSLIYVDVRYRGVKAGAEETINQLLELSRKNEKERVDKESQGIQ